MNQSHGGNKDSKNILCLMEATFSQGPSCKYSLVVTTKCSCL